MSRYRVVQCWDDESIKELKNLENLMLHLKENTRLEDHDLNPWFWLAVGSINEKQKLREVCGL